MKKINNTILKDYYESYAFVTPKHLQDAGLFSSANLGKWFVLDSFSYIKNIKQIFSLLFQLTNNNVKKNKILFILDDDIYFFFDKTFKSHHFLTNELKNGLHFLQTSKYASPVVAVIYIGKNHDISPKVLNQLNIPFFCFSTKSRIYFDYFSYTSLTFHGSILYLKTVLKTILIPKTNTNINEKTYL